MHCSSKNNTDRDELISDQPPPYETANTHMQQQQHVPPTVIVNNTTVIQQSPVISVPVESLDVNRFCNETPRAVRRIFMRNLFFVIAAQFLLIDVALLIFVPLVRAELICDRHQSYYFYIFWILSIAILAIISFWERARRIPPANYVTIIIFTIFQGTTLGFAATFEPMSLVLLASVGTTAIVCLATALFQLQGRYHLGNFRSLLFVWVLIGVCFGISLSFLSCYQAGFAAGLSIFFCTYLVVNAQMMVRGTTRYVLSRKEYVFGAMNIYVDIVHGILICLGGIGICGCGIFSCCKVCEN